MDRVKIEVPRSSVTVRIGRHRFRSREDPRPVAVSFSCQTLSPLHSTRCASAHDVPRRASRGEADGAKYGVPHLQGTLPEIISKEFLTYTGTLARLLDQCDGPAPSSPIRSRRPSPRCSSACLFTANRTMINERDQGNKHAGAFNSERPGCQRRR